MAAVELKNRILSFMERADDRVLSIVNSVFENYYQDEQVAFHPDGTPMTRKEYRMALDAAEEQVANGDFTSVEDLESEQ